MKNNLISRKDFLKLSVGLTLGSSLAYYFLKSDGKNKIRSVGKNSEHFAVVVYIPGGLDCTLGLDPQIYSQGLDSEDIFIEYLENDITKKGNINLGPAAKALASHYQDICVVNGLSSLKDLGHKLNLQQMLTGSVNENFNHFSVQLASKSQQKPFGVLTNAEIINQNSDLAISDIANLNELFLSSKQGIIIPGLSQILDGKIKTDAFETENAEEISREIFNSVTNKKSSAQVSFSTLAACFAGGLAGSAEVDISRFINENYLDSHTNHEKTHLSSQTQAWDYVSQLFDIFKSVPYQQKSFFDYTSFVVVTEFSRTPNLNLAKGKDHNPYTNSILLAGKGIKGNQTIGKSKVWSRKQTVDKFSLHTGLPIDFSTGSIIHEPSQQTELITPETLAKTLLNLFELQDSSNILKNFKIIPNIIKT